MKYLHYFALWLILCMPTLLRVCIHNKAEVLLLVNYQHTH